MDKKKTLLQFIKFNIVGVLNTAVDFGVYTLLTALGVYYIAAQVASYACGMLNSYLWNTGWTFKQKERRSIKTFAAFLTVNLISLGVSVAVLYLCRNALHIQSDILCKVVATPASLAVNFIGNKLFVFKEN